MTIIAKQVCVIKRRERKPVLKMPHFASLAAAIATVAARRLPALDPKDRIPENGNPVYLCCMARAAMRPARSSTGLAIFFELRS
jgi:hypothetical protein